MSIKTRLAKIEASKNPKLVIVVSSPDETADACIHRHFTALGLDKPEKLLIVITGIPA